MFGILLGQGMGFDSSAVKLTLRFVFCSWLLVTIVISNGYIGIVNSLMAKLIIPSHSTTVQEWQMDIFSLDVTIAIRAHGSLGYEAKPAVGLEGSQISALLIANTKRVTPTSLTPPQEGKCSESVQGCDAILNGTKIGVATGSSKEFYPQTFPKNFAVLQRGK